MKDMKNNLDVVKSVDPATYNSDQTGAGVDLRGFGSSMAAVQSGALTDGAHTPKLQESDDDATYTDAPATDLEGSFANISANAIQRVGYKGSKRYIRVFVTSNGATGAIYSASIVRGLPSIAPVA